jgi:predicted nuclease with TOPRIM domain
MKNINDVSTDGQAQPDELNELGAIVEEFTNRLATLDQQISGLKEDRKDLIDEYREKLDMKTLNAAMKIVKTKRAAEHKHTLDQFMTVIEERDLPV